MKEEEAKNKWVQWGLVNGPELAHIHLEHALINQWLSVEIMEETTKSFLIQKKVSTRK